MPGIGFEGGTELPQGPAFRDSRVLKIPPARTPLTPALAKAPPESPARILSAVRLRLKFVMAAAFTVRAALKFQNAELDEDIVLIVGRCVGDEIDRQIEAIDRVIGRLLPGVRGKEAPR